VAILVDCPVCAETLQAPDAAAGKGCPCPACRSLVSVPINTPEPIATGRVCACPTCGKSLTITPELEAVEVACPFCAREFRSDGAAVSRPRRRRFRCPYCGTRERPEETRRITAAGWAIFAVFLVFFFPLFWVGLLITESERRCYDCRRRLD
jgi:hypothetical protein